MITLRKIGTKILSFLGLTDTPDSYIGHGGKLLSVKNDETGLTFTESIPYSFTNLIDAPTTYSGFEDCYVKVNSTGDGLYFSSVYNNIQDGVIKIDNGAPFIYATFTAPLNTPEYSLSVSIENKIDNNPSVYSTLIVDKTVYGFKVIFSGDIDSDNYYLNWQIIASSIVNDKTLTYSDRSVQDKELNTLEDTVYSSEPEYVDDLHTDNNLILIDPYPISTTVSGGYVRGYNGEASEMFVAINNSSVGDGFGTPLYMRPDGKFGTCTAISGSMQMPCLAIAIEGGDGDYKKILWNGIIRKGEWSWTPGKTIYVSTVEGALTQAMPNNGHIKQPIGIAIQSDTIKFNPGFYPGYTPGI